MGSRPCVLTSRASSSTSTQGYQRGSHQHTLSPESTLCLCHVCHASLGQAVSAVLADVCLHALWSVTVLSIALRTAGLWRCHVEVDVHSRLSLCDVHLEHVVLVTRWHKSLMISLRTCTFICASSRRLLARSLTIAHHRSLDLSSTFCMNSSTSALFSMPAVHIAIFLSTFSTMCLNML